jgi:hypothetical protein
MANRRRQSELERLIAEAVAVSFFEMQGGSRSDGTSPAPTAGDRQLAFDIAQALKQANLAVEPEGPQSLVSQLVRLLRENVDEDDKHFFDTDSANTTINGVFSTEKLESALSEQEAQALERLAAKWPTAPRDMVSRGMVKDWILNEARALRNADEEDDIEKLMDW